MVVGLLANKIRRAVPRLLISCSLPSRHARLLMSTESEFMKIAEVAGSASTSEELRLCKIGGCCGKDTPLMPADAVAARLGALPMWNLSEDGKVISKTFVAKHCAEGPKHALPAALPRTTCV